MLSRNVANLGSRLIEADAFPFEFLSELGERESWRKELHRPIYHVHKWWAMRLGSVFRGIILGCLLPDSADLPTCFYEKHSFDTVSVFDPFMGSGTTVGEAYKLGCTVLGRDINPVACESVRVAMGALDRTELMSAFSHLSATVGERIRHLYESRDSAGRVCEALYYFWVKHVECPYCASKTDLFPSRIIARNAYPGRKPEVQICCPDCRAVFRHPNADRRVECPTCKSAFDPHVGSANGTIATCSTCSRDFQIVEAIRRSPGPPEHRLYAKLLLTPEGDKVYLPTTPEDTEAYTQCSNLLRDELESGSIRLPHAVLTDGFNTRQAIGHNYRAWRDFFNDRHLLALGWLQQSISELADATTRDALLLLFSGVLEFNNLFASYKGEGTGAVRHMFSHHILKPERTPIEANVWGTPKSSGAFSTLFKSRLMRALDYRAAPFELGGNGSIKRFYCSPAFGNDALSSWPVNGAIRKHSICLSCGSSDATGLPEGSVDLVVTDPPFFDNVHYSELADFFYAWQTLYPRGFVDTASSTRDTREVQDGDADSFSAKLQAVFSESHRVLKDDGMLAFTYHHSRAEGWESLTSALYDAGFAVANAHPVRAEMSGGTPKSQAKEPIQLDIVFACRKRDRVTRPVLDPEDALAAAASSARSKVERLASCGLALSRNDCRVVVFSQFICELGPTALSVASHRMMQPGGSLDQLSNDLYASVACAGKRGIAEPQLTLISQEAM